MSPPNEEILNRWWWISGCWWSNLYGDRRRTWVYSLRRIQGWCRLCFPRILLIGGEWMIRRVTPRLCIRCKGRNTSAIISLCEYWGRYIQVSPKEDATFECTYGQRNQYTIDEWIVQLRESVWRYVKSEDPILIKTRIHDLICIKWHRYKYISG